LQLILFAAGKGIHNERAERAILAGAKDFPEYEDPRINTKEAEEDKQRKIKESLEVLTKAGLNGR
jgi:hypothetical protein